MAILKYLLAFEVISSIHMVQHTNMTTDHTYLNLGLCSPIGNALECEAGVLRSIHSSGQIKCTLHGPTTCSGHYGLKRCPIHESQNLASMGQHDLRIKALNKGNTYLLSMRSVIYLSCR